MATTSHIAPRDMAKAHLKVIKYAINDVSLLAATQSNTSKAPKRNCVVLIFAHKLISFLYFLVCGIWQRVCESQSPNVT